MRIGIILIASFALLFVAWISISRPIWASAAPATTNEVDPSRLEEHVRLLAQSTPSRDFEHLESLDRVAAYIKDHLQQAGGSVSEQIFHVEDWNKQNQQINRGPYKNIIATFGPDTPERIVVGAHYDVCGPFSGADDNASGVAGLLEIARLLGKAPPATRVELVAYTLEEPPYFGSDSMGSAIHAASLVKAGIKVRAMISLEMLGYFSDRPHTQEFPMPLLRLFYPTTGNFITVVGKFIDGSLAKHVKRSMQKVHKLSVYSINSPTWVPGVDFSDHRNYWRYGYPAVMITDTAFLRNHAYHTANDTPERLDYQRMALVVEGAFHAIQDLSAEKSSARKIKL